MEAEEAEQRILDDGPASGEAVLVAPQSGLGCADSVRKEVRSVEFVIANELVDRAVELVCSGLRAHEHLGPHAVAVLGGHVVGHDLKLADRIYGRLCGLGLEAQSAARVAGRIVGAVEQHVGLGRMHADCQDAALAAAHAVVARALAHFAGRQHADGELSQLEVVATVERHFKNALGVNNLADLSLLGLD